LSNGGSLKGSVLSVRSGLAVTVVFSFFDGLADGEPSALVFSWDGLGDGEAFGLAAWPGVTSRHPSRMVRAQVAITVREKNGAAGGMSFCII
jgi:hypothetical protein